MEFEQKDYEGARGFADRIANNADNIRDIFDDIDNTMDELYGNDWSSSGAENAKERYNEYRGKYELFYNDIMEKKDHIYEVTERAEEADISASNVLEGTTSTTGIGSVAAGMAAEAARKDTVN